ncbi:hypothetical protein DVH24_027496 [Malus domestica]|uniref:Uncharacterized protein n=1 Tax=Malus domestica TaxID=3750 RepID=A0A498KQK4_MALDO|nr:hypothetical protein DVH24_027496 [Malus domestica]
MITRRRSVSNAAPALSASSAPGVSAPGVSAPLIGEPTPLTESTPTTSQVPVSSTSSVSIEFLSARRPHRRRREPEPSDHPSRPPESRMGPPNQEFLSYAVGELGKNSGGDEVPGARQLGGRF